MIDDTTRWDIIHKKSHRGDEPQSIYAQEKETLFPKNSLIVDLGAGRGADAVYFLRKGHSVVAFDISPYAISVLTDKAKKENLASKLATRIVDFGLHALPVKDSSVDVVYSRISLNYFGASQTTKIFKDIYRLLKPGGKAFLSMKSPDDDVEMEYLKRNSTIYEDNVYIEGEMLRSRFTKEQLIVIIKNAGISNYNVVPFQEDMTIKGEMHAKMLHVKCKILQVIIKTQIPFVNTHYSRSA